MKDFYLIPNTLKFELGECAHFHKPDGVFLSRSAYWKLKHLGKESIQLFFNLRLKNVPEDEAISQVTKEEEERK